jgi:signal transduction histidine kinase
MGEMIENIAHQWRQPLSQINSSVLVLESYLDSNAHNYSKIEAKLLEIENSTLYMSKTIESFKNFFAKNKPQTSFSIKELINSSLLILDNTTRTDKIEIEIDIVGKETYFGLEDELQQVIIILLNNAKDILIEKNIKKPKIYIKTEYIEEIFFIKICDNGSGIGQDIIDKIFEPYFTTKHKSQGTGLGLYISKLIIEENMFGILSVKSQNNSTCFTIELPSKDTCLI